MITWPFIITFNICFQSDNFWTLCNINSSVAVDPLVLFSSNHVNYSFLCVLIIAKKDTQTDIINAINKPGKPDTPSIENPLKKRTQNNFHASLHTQISTFC